MLCLNLDDTLDMVYICMSHIYGKIQGLLLPQIAVELFLPKTKTQKEYYTTSRLVTITKQNLIIIATQTHSPQTHTTITKPCLITPLMMYHQLSR